MSARPSRWKLRIARFMRVKPICELVWYVRYLYFMKVRRSFRAYDDNFGVAASEYSRRIILIGRPSDRILKLIMPLATIDRMNYDSKILSIGCRFEADLLYLAAYGFNSANVRGLDLYSYSPWIDLGNMHSTSYADSSWDAAVLGWVLAYSTEPQTAAREVTRIVRPGGLVAIGVTYYPEHVLKKFIADGIDFGVENRIQTVDAILDLFKGHVGAVYFRHDASDPTKQSSCLVIFSIEK